MTGSLATARSLRLRPLYLRERWHAAWLVGQRAIHSALLGLGFYATVSLALLLASLLVRNNLEFAQENSLVVMIRPLYLPIFVSTVLLSLYLALSATLSVTRERDRGTLLLLFFGPMDEWAYLLGRLVGQTGLFTLAMLLATAWALLFARLTNLAINPDLLLVLLFALLANAGVVAFGLLMAAWGRTSRTALVLFVLITLLVLAIQFGDQAILQLAAKAQPNRRDPILFLRQLLAGLNWAIQWISPYVQLSQAMDALVVGNPLALAQRGVTLLLQAGLLFGAAVAVLKRSGVR